MCFAYRTSLLPSRATVLVQFECAPLLRRLQSRGSVELRTVSGYRVRWRNCGDLAWAMNSASSVTQPLDPPEVMSVLSFDDDSSRLLSNGYLGTGRCRSARVLEGHSRQASGSGYRAGAALLRAVLLLVRNAARGSACESSLAQKPSRSRIVPGRGDSLPDKTTHGSTLPAHKRVLKIPMSGQRKERP